MTTTIKVKPTVVWTCDERDMTITVIGLPMSRRQVIRCMRKRLERHALDSPASCFVRITKDAIVVFWYDDKTEAALAEEKRTYFRERAAAEVLA